MIFIKHSTRFLSLLLIIATLLFCLSACADKPETSKASSPSVSSSTSRSKPSASDDGYIANKSSKKVHTPDCSYLPAEKNRVYYDDLDEALDDGYEPCKKCHPER